MLKRLFDLIFALPGVVVLSPLLLVVAIWVRVDSKGPILFRQVRVGRFGDEFNILKFRTMISCSESAGPKITFGKDSRITRCGQFLRQSKLDELPQLFNVVKGEMSLVGPRPEVPEYVAIYPQRLRSKIFSVRPGITDLASLEYRHESEMLAESKDPAKAYVEEVLPSKLAYCEKYIDNQSLWLDVKIIFRTLWSIFR